MYYLYKNPLDDNEYTSGRYETGESTIATYESLISWCKAWTKLHPNYKVMEQTVKNFGLKLNTQNAVIGQRVIDASLGALAVSIIGVIIGLLIKGNQLLLI